jgi:membrane fusion protein (multidrug efflux system)
MKTKTKLWIAIVVGLFVIIGALIGIKAGQIGSMIKAGKSFVPPPESVSSAQVEAADWPGVTSAVGSLVAVQGVTLAAEVSGTVRQIGFDSGAAVKRGALLLKLDTSTEEAQLASATAEATLAKLTLQRARALRQGGANAPADLEAAQARAQQAEAAVATLQATIAKKSIRAPFDGRLAIRQVELGQVVSSGAPVATLHAITPIFAEFSLPQQALADVKAGQPVHMHTDVFPEARWDGEITVVNTQVDPATRNVRIRATFPNADGRLLPGMFVAVDVVSTSHRPVLVIPATAVLYAPYGDSVYTIEEKKDAAGKSRKIARQKFVRLGERRGDFVAVQSGLEAGETIVSSGGFKLKNGAAVAVNNSLAPQAELAPKPAE